MNRLPLLVTALLLALACGRSFPASAPSGSGLAGSGGTPGTGGKGGTGGAGGTGGTGGTGGSSAGGTGGFAGTGAGGSDPCGGAGGEPACEDRGLETCECFDDCRYLVPGCGMPALPAEGCYDAYDCRQVGCARGTQCQMVWYDPCWNSNCDACAAPTYLCLPPPADPCEGATLDGAGHCVGADGSTRDQACCGWDCDRTKILCKSMEPACPAGQVAPVQDGCWVTPCVDAGACVQELEPVLCAYTGGFWNPKGCGHSKCGVVVDCKVPVPGCLCGPTQIFEPQVGCVESDACMDTGARALCEKTAGTWDEMSCGHYVCGVRPSCEAVIPGCNCGAGAVFDGSKGCTVSTKCFAGEGEPCGGTTGKTCLQGLACVRDGTGSSSGTCRRR